MKKLRPILLFCVLLAAAAALLLALNARYPVLAQTDTLPADIASRLYLVSARFEGSRAAFDFTCQQPPGSDLRMVFSDVNAIRVEQDGVVVYESSEDDPYRRTQSIPLSAAQLQARGGTRIVLTLLERGQTPTEAVTGLRIAPMKTLIGSSAQIERVSLCVFGASMLLMGVCALACIICLLLFIGKPSERYLLLLSIVSLLCAVTSLFIADNPLMALTFAQHSVLRPLISIFPVILHAAICFYLCEDCLPRRMRGMLPMSLLVLLAVALVLLRALTSFSFYTIARLLLIVPVCAVLCRACRRRMWGAYLLLGGYALGESITLAIFIINNVGSILPGGEMVFVNPSYLSYMGVVIAALVIACHRFSAKFTESEALGTRLAAVNRELDQRVIERTSQLETEQKHRRTMMLNVIHDLRSPLFVLQGTLEQMTLVSSEDRQLREVMDRKLAYLQRLTEDLFMTAKLEDDAVFYEEDRVDLCGVLRELYEENLSEGRRRHIELALRCDDAPMTVWVDPMRIRQAVANLIDNALTYTPRDGKITLELRRGPDGARLSVSDTGKGIAPADLPNVFDRYYSVSRADNPKSSGLGLAIAREIVQHSHGELTVSSALGQGTCFTLCLPLLTD
ncbi:MAG: HAMP domain-containing sensor histidine kinase [Eubacteriales bacterium]|nr:HAMP domain-containing sensor histidine kinase [Eubacteriales bacterium]